MFKVPSFHIQEACHLCLKDIRTLSIKYNFLKLELNKDRIELNQLSHQSELLNLKGKILVKQTETCYQCVQRSLFCVRQDKC